MVKLDEAIGGIGAYVGVKQQYALEPVLIKRLAVKHGQSPETVSALLDTVLSLVYAPLDLKGILGVRRTLEILVEEILALDSEVEEESEVAQDILSDFFDFLETCPPDSDMRKGKIYYKDDPFYKCYLKAFASEDDISQKDKEECFRFFCRAIAASMKREHAAEHVTGTQNSYGLAIRVFMRYLPAEIKRARLYDPTRMSEYISKAIAFFDVKRSKNRTRSKDRTDELTDTALGYIVDLKRAFRIKGKFGSGRGEAPEPIETEKVEPFVFEPESPAAGNPVNTKGSEKYWIPPAVPGLRVKKPRPRDGDNPDDGDEAVPDEWLFPGGDASPASVPKPPSLDFRLADTLHLRYFNFFFDAQFLNLFHLAQLHLYVHEHWSTATPQLQATMMVSLLSCHTGSDPREVANLGIADSEQTVDLNEYDLIIVRKGDGFILYRRTIIERKPKTDEDSRFKISSEVQYTLPAFLAYYLLNSKLNIAKPGYLFGVPPDFDRPTINIDTIKAFLAGANKKYLLNLTPSRLARSFFPMYSGRCGLDPLIACYVSGDDMMMHSAALHYVRIWASSLDKSYLSAADMVAEKICKNLQTMIECKLLPKSQASENLDGILNMKSGSLAGRKSIVYGSPFAASADDVWMFVEDLKLHIRRRRWRNIVERHNLYTCYLYLCLQFSFAHRPRNVIAYTLASLTRGAHVVIADKLSKAYREERLLPVNNVLANLCRNYIDGQPVVIEYIARKIRPQLTREPKPSPLAFITVEGRWQKFTISNFHEYLQKARVPYCFDNKMPLTLCADATLRKGLL